MSSKTLRHLALDLLAQREHSCLELFRKLSKHDFAAEEINALLDQLEKENLLSDERFTEAYVNWRSKRGYGPLHIKQELQEKGIATHLIQEHITNKEWLQSAQQVRIKKFGNELPNDFPGRAKQMRFLQYRGFTMEQISAVLKTESDNL